MLRKIFLPLFSVLLFFLVLEGSSYFLYRANIRLHWEESYDPGEIWILEQAGEIAKQNTRDGKLARIILSKGYDPGISIWSPRYDELNLEPPVYLPSESRKPFLYKPWKITPNLNDYFPVIGARTSRLKYKAHYTTDESGRRLGFMPEKSNETYVFLGCSFTFGTGVNNEEAFPYQFGRKTGARTYNLGIPGSSPATFLYRMRNENVTLLEDIQGENVTVVLTIIPDHLNRVVGTTHLFRMPTAYELHQYFYMAGDKLEMSPSFASGPGVDKLFFKSIAQSNFLSVLNLDLPILQDEEYLLFARVIEEIQTRMKNSGKVSRFVVALFPTGRGHAKYEGVKTMLKKLNIEVLDYSTIKSASLLGHSYTLKYDGHPSPLMYDLYTDFLASDLISENIVK